MSEDAEAERIARWLDEQAEEAKTLSRNARARGDAPGMSAHATVAWLARRWARNIRDGKHRDRE